MTILTKPFTEKKGDKLDVPLVENEKLPVPVSFTFIIYMGGTSIYICLFIFSFI